MASRKGLTSKQKSFIAEYVSNGGHGTNAALASYDTDYNGARSIASQNIAKLNVRAEIESALAEANLTPKRLAWTVADALTATSTIPIGPGESVTKPDHTTRLKAVDIAAKLGDLYPRDSAKHEHRHLHIESSEDPAVLRFKVLHGRAPTDREIADLKVNNAKSTSK